MSERTKGRCMGCKIVWSWTGPAYEPKCPTCGERLAVGRLLIERAKKNGYPTQRARSTDAGLRQGSRP